MTSGPCGWAAAVPPSSRDAQATAPTPTAAAAARPMIAARARPRTGTPGPVSSSAGRATRAAPPRLGGGRGRGGRVASSRPSAACTSSSRAAAAVGGRSSGRRARRRDTASATAPGTSGAGTADGGRVALQAGDGDGAVRGARERGLAREALVQHEAQRVEVGPAVEREAEDLLGRQVLRRAHHHVLGREVLVAALHGLGDAEVRQLHAALGGDEDVARLDVAVDETGLVGVVERGGHRSPDHERLVDAQPPGLVQEVAQRAPGDQLHDHRSPAVGLDGVVDADDVRVVQPGGGDGLPPEALDHDRVVGQGCLEQLDRDLAIERRVGGHPHLAHAAVSQSPIETVPLGEKRRVGGPGRRRSGRGHRTTTLVEGSVASRASPRSSAHGRHGVRISVPVRTAWSGTRRRWRPARSARR